MAAFYDEQTRPCAGDNDAVPPRATSEEGTNLTDHGRQCLSTPTALLRNNCNCAAGKSLKRDLVIAEIQLSSSLLSFNFATRPACTDKAIHAHGYRDRVDTGCLYSSFVENQLKHTTAEPLCQCGEQDCANYNNCRFLLMLPGRRRKREFQLRIETRAQHRCRIAAMIHSAGWAN